MVRHTVLIGCGRRGTGVLGALFGPQLGSLVVVDTDAARTERMERSGASSVTGSGTDVTTLRLADVPRATRVIVAVANDATALRVLRAVRGLNDQATVLVCLREPWWRKLGLHLGADHVVVEEEEPADDPAAAGGELTLVDREVLWSEIGTYPSECSPGVPRPRSPHRPT